MYDIRFGSEFDYLAKMVAHHQEAVTASGQLQRSSRAEMRTLGASIVRTQTAEIATLEKWLAAWHPGRPMEVDCQPMLRDLSQAVGRRAGQGVPAGHDPPHLMVAVMMSQQLLMRGGGTQGHQGVRGPCP